MNVPLRAEARRLGRMAAPELPPAYLEQNFVSLPLSPHHDDGGSGSAAGAETGRPWFAPLPFATSEGSCTCRRMRGSEAIASFDTAWGSSPQHR